MSKEDILISCSYGTVTKLDLHDNPHLDRDLRNVDVTIRVTNKTLNFPYILFKDEPYYGMHVIYQVYKRPDGTRYHKVVHDEEYDSEYNSIRIYNMMKDNENKEELVDGKVLENNDALKKVYERYSYAPGAYACTDETNQNTNKVVEGKCQTDNTQKPVSSHPLALKRGGKPVTNANAGASEYITSVCNRVSDSNLDPQLKQDILREFRKKTGKSYHNNPVSRGGVPVTHLKEKDRADRKACEDLIENLSKVADELGDYGKVTSDDVTWREVIDDFKNKNTETVTAFTKKSDPEWFDKWTPDAEDVKDPQKQIVALEKDFVNAQLRFLSERRKFLEIKQNLNKKYKKLGIDELRD